MFERYVSRPRILQTFGWNVERVLSCDWLHDPEGVLRRLERALKRAPGEKDQAVAEADEAVAAAVAEAAASNESETLAQAPAEPHSAPRPARDAVPAPAPADNMRRFEFTEGDSRKFWQIGRTGSDVTVSWGRIGTKGQLQIKQLGDEARAERELQKLIAERSGRATSRSARDPELRCPRGLVIKPHHFSSSHPLNQPSPEDFSLPAWAYTDPEFLALERERVFRPSWQVICHVSEIPKPGDYQCFDFIGEMLFAMRGNDGAVRAFHNVCRHRASRLLDGPRGSCTPAHHLSLPCMVVRLRRPPGLGGRSQRFSASRHLARIAGAGGDGDLRGLRVRAHPGRRPERRAR